MQIVHTTMQIVQIYLGKNYPYSTMQKLFAKISLEIRRRNAYCFAKSAQKGGVRIEPALECSIRQRYAGGNQQLRAADAPKLDVLVHRRVRVTDELV